MGEVTLKKALDEYKNLYMPARNFSERTRIEYGHDVEELITFLEATGGKRAGELAVPVIERYLAELDRRGVAGTTRKRKVVSIRSFFSFLYQNSYIAVNLGKRIIPPKAELKNPRFLTEKEYNRLLSAAAQSPRDYAIIQLLLQTGIKLSELTRLTVNNIDLPSSVTSEKDISGNLSIRGGKRQQERVLPLNEKACQAISNYLTVRSPATSQILFLNRFEKPLSARGVEKVVSKYCEQVGIEGASVHSLRHTFGTHHAAKGTSFETIQITMGHKDARSTSLYLVLAREIEKKELQENAL